MQSTHSELRQGPVFNLLMESQSQPSQQASNWENTCNHRSFTHNFESLNKIDVCLKGKIRLPTVAIDNKIYQRLAAPRQKRYQHRRIETQQNPQSSPNYHKVNLQSEELLFFKKNKPADEYFPVLPHRSRSLSIVVHLLKGKNQHQKSMEINTRKIIHNLNHLKARFQAKELENFNMRKQKQTRQKLSFPKYNKNKKTSNFPKNNLDDKQNKLIKGYFNNSIYRLIDRKNSNRSLTFKKY